MIPTNFAWSDKSRAFILMVFILGLKQKRQFIKCIFKISLYKASHEKQRIC